MENFDDFDELLEAAKKADEEKGIKPGQRTCQVGQGRCESCEG